MLKGVGLELRNGIGKWLCLPLAILGVFAAEHQIPAGTAIWPYVVSALGPAVELMGPFAAGAAAFAGSRCKRRSTEVIEQLAVRSPATSGLAEVAALVIWVAIAFLAVVAVTYIPAALSATWSGPDAGRTVAAGLGLFLEATLGYVVGRLAPFRFTPVFVAAAMYALVVVGGSSFLDYRLALLTPVNTQLYDVFNRLNHAVGIGQILWYVGVSMLLLALWSFKQSRGVRAAQVAVLAGALSIAGGAVLVAQHGNSNEAGVVVRWKCAGRDPQVCIHPALAGVRSELDRTVNPVLGRLRGTPFAVSRLEQRPRGLGSRPTAGSVAFALDDAANSSVHDVAQDVAINALGFSDSCFRQSGASDGYPYAQLLASWVAGDPNLFVPFDAAEAAAKRSFYALSVKGRREFLITHVSQIRACTLSGRDFAKV